ncbi:hypothetical protein [Promicromonospora soli]
MTSSPGIPSPEQVRDLSDAQIEAAFSTWWTYHNAPEYLAGREAVVRAAGGTLYELGELIDSDAKLSALARAVRERAWSVQGLKGLDSSVRWAYLAGTHPDAVTPEQAHALTAGWSAAIAPHPKPWWARLRRALGLARATG